MPLDVSGLAALAGTFGGVGSVEDFEQCVLAARSGRQWASPPLATLRETLASAPGGTTRFLSDTLPSIVRHAARVEELFPEGVPYLDCAAASAAAMRQGAANAHASVSLSRPQLASLLSCAFLCIVPGRDHHDELPGFGPFSFLRLFAEGGCEQYKAAKLQLLLQYFERLDEAAAPAEGSELRLRRIAVVETLAPAWADCQSALPELAVQWDGAMEDCAESVQVGMSNRYPGGAPGGVLATGKMQEPIYFACRPELLVMLLLCPAIAPHEALLAEGARLFGAAVGVGKEMRARAEPPTAVEVERAATQALLVVDAIDFRKPESYPQFAEVGVHRELLKLCAGFRLGSHVRGVAATGNWCCDAFGGDKQLKLALQLIAAGEAGIRMLCLYPNAFEGDHTERSELAGLEMLRHYGTVGELYGAVQRFVTLTNGEPKEGQLFKYLQTLQAIRSEDGRLD